MRRIKFKSIISAILSVVLTVSSLPVSAVSGMSVENIGFDDSKVISEDTAESTHILYELKEKRETNTKHFLMSDGSYMAAQYDEPVHYLTENGVWEEYDNTMVADADEYSNKKSDKNITLSKKVKQNKTVEISVDGYRISWGFDNAAASAVELIQHEHFYSSQDDAFLTVPDAVKEARYNNVYPDVDLQYFITPEGVKENIILNSDAARRQFTVNYNIDGLSAVSVDSKTIELRNSDDKTVYVIHAPVMEDASGSESTDVYLSIVKANGNHISVCVTVDEAWLDDQNRAYPVTIDPLVKQESAKNFKIDCYVSKTSNGTQSVNSGARHTYVGMTADGINRTFLKTDMPVLGIGDVITKASLYLTSTQNALLGDGDYKVDAYYITADWSTDNISFDQPCDSNVLDYCMVSTADATYGWDITRSAKHWQNGASNYGIMLKGSSESGIVGRRFYNYKNTDSATRPYVYVYYINTTGLNDYNSYKTYDYGIYGALHINEYRGSITYTFNDISYSGNILNANIYHVYNSDNYDDVSPYGKGWSLNICENLQHIHGTSGLDDRYHYRYTDEDGTQIYFKAADKADTFEDEVGRGWTLTNGGSGDWTLTIEDKAGNKKGYDNNGYLKIVRDKDGNEMTFGYTGSFVTSVTDSSGRVTVLSYADGLLDHIQDPAGRKTYYRYSADGYLTDVERYTDEDIAFYYYKGRLDTVYMNTSRIAIAYINDRFCYLGEGAVGEDYTVKLWADYINDGKNIFTHLGLSGNISGSDRILEHCLFNSWGQKITTYITDADGNIPDKVSTNRYSSNNLVNSKTNNKLQEAYAVSSAVNMLPDGSFENGGSWDTIYWSPHTQTVSSISAETNIANAYIGQNVARITADTASESTVSFYKNLYNVTAGTYTLSGYVKTENLQGWAGAFLSGTLYYNDGRACEDNFSQHILGTTDSEVENGWRRISVTFTVPSSNISHIQLHAGIRGGTTGTAWFDCIQLEKGDQASEYNLIENAGFEQTGSWTANVSDSGDGNSDWQHFQGNQAYKIAGNHLKNKNICQTVDVYGSGEDVYILSAWAKAASVSLDDPSRNFYIECKVEYTDGSVYWPGFHKFDAFNTDWQYLSIPFSVKNGDKQPKSITVYAGYFNNQNTCYFDNIQLVKDKTQSYVYDDDGNLKNAVTAADENSSFEYSDNEVVKSVANTGHKYYNTYSSSNKHLLIASYADGVSYRFEHDSKGNVTSTSAISSDIVDGGVYAFRTHYSDRAVDIFNSETTDGTQAISFKWNNTANQHFRLARVEGTEYYSIHPVIAPDKAFTVLDAGQVSGTDICLFTYTGAYHQQFRFELQPNGSYHVIPRHDESKCWDTWDANGADIEIWSKNSQTGKDIVVEALQAADGSLKMQSSAVYTPSGQYISSVTDTLGNSVSYTYDETKGELTGTTDANGNTTRYENSYGAVNTTWIIADKDKNGTYSDGESYVRSRYSKGLLTSIDNNKTYYSFGYDAYGNRISTSVGNHTLSTNTYNTVLGNLTKVQYGNGHETRYVYDNFGRVSEVWKESPGVLHAFLYKYDKNGNLASLQEGSTATVTKFGYDSIGRLVNAVSDNGFERYQSYDAFNRINKITYIRGGTSQTYKFNYNQKNFIGSVNLPTGKTISSSYDGLNRLTSTSVNTTTPITEQYTYKNGVNGTTSPLVETFKTLQGTYSYTYDANGNIKSIRLNGALYESYTYDHLNQLKTVTKGTDTWEYTYDSCGNILTVKLNGEVTDSYGYSDIQWKDKLTNLNGQTVTYDAIGNPLQYRDGMTFSWKYGRTLEYLYSENYNIFYRQNADGIRVQKHITDNSDGTTESHYYDYNGTQLVCERWENNTVWYMYDESGSPIGLTYNGTEYYYLKNLQGDITGIADANGSIVAEYTYNAWGKLLSITDADGNDISSNTAHIGTINPLRYRGYYYDNETGFYLTGTRYYDPEIGRFINADGEISDVGGNVLGYNLFAYCFNNPVNMDDPTGQWPKWLTGALNVVSGVAQMAAGAALGAFTSWTGVGAVAAGFLIVNGAATATQGIGQIVNDVTKTNVLREDNIVRTAVKDVGRAIGGDTGAKIAGGAYDVAAVAANLYAGKVGLQQTGLAPIKVNINKVLNNPMDEFVTCGPAPGVISDYCRSIPLNGYGKIYATQLPNGFYQLANGHHRVAALRSLGKETIKIFLTK